MARDDGGGTVAGATGDRRPATEPAFRDAAIAELADARPLRDNGFKIELAKRTIVAVLGDLSGATA